MNRFVADRLSIKGRITLWYAALLVLICLCVVFVLSLASEHASMAYYEKTLHSASYILLDEMEVEHGLLEIDDDIDDVPNVYAALFNEQGDLVYGRKWVSVPFEKDVVRRVHEGKHSWYVLDTHVSVKGYENLWLRMHMSSDVSDSVRASVLHGGWWFLPLLAALALLGGYMVTARAFFPVFKMNEVTRSITKGEDLSARIPVKETFRSDELSDLGKTINDMLARLELSFKREAQFTADAAHELRTPLNRIVTQCEYALSLNDAQEKDDALSCTLDAAQDMNALISQLLLLSRLDAGQTPLDEECDLAQIVAQIAEDMLPLMQEKRMTLRLQTLSCTLHGNRSILSRMLVNLLDNAVRYGKEGGEIAVLMRREGGNILLTVENEGVGLSEQDAEKVFTRFWRSDRSRSTPGTGVGLSLVMSAAKAHGGSAKAFGIPGERAVFTITLPENEK